MSLMDIKEYVQFRDAMDREIKTASEGFVRIGYLLKIARDTEILRNSGYHSVTEFAISRYGLTPDIVSRYIAINDRFSEGGYSDILEQRYRGYGVSKLAEMLTLSDEIIAAVPAVATRSDIRKIKAEIAEELEKTDIEVMLEPTQTKEKTLIQEVLYEYFEKMPERYPKVFSAAYQNDAEQAVLEVFAPTGSALAMVRVSQKGKMMFSIEGREISITCIRTHTRSEYTPTQLLEEIKSMCPIEKSVKEAWKALYGYQFPQDIGTEETKKKTVEMLTEEKRDVKRESKKEKKQESKKEAGQQETPTQPAEKAQKQQKKAEIEPAQEWLIDMKKVFMTALGHAEKGDWNKWEECMKQAVKISTVIRKMQQDRQIPGQMEMEEVK